MDFLPKLKLDLEKNGELYLKIKVIPGAPKTEMRTEMADGTLKIAVAAVPEKGKANLALIDFLAEEFGVRRNNVNIISGAGARVKLVKIKN